MFKKLLIQSHNIISAIFYIAFLLFGITQIIHAKSTSSALFYLFITLIMLAIALYSEYLRSLYQKAIKKQIFDLDSIESRLIFNKVMKKDFFKAYINSQAIFDTLYYADEMQPEKCLQVLEENSKFFHGSLDSLLIYHYTKFYAAFMMKNDNIVKEEYHSIMQMKETKIKGKKLSPLYNWDFIDAIYLFSRKNYKQSINKFNEINIENMNNREIMHLYYQKGRLYTILKDDSKARYCFDEVIRIGGTSKMKESALMLRRKVNS